MNKIKALVISSVLLMLTGACSDNATTSSNAPDSTEKVGEVPTTKTIETNHSNSASQMRRDQLNSDIRAREQRNSITGGGTSRDRGDLSNEVRSKLQANIPKGNLTVAAKDGDVVVSGTVTTQAQFDKIEPLAKEIKGVKSVKVAAKVVTAVPDKK